MKKNTSNLSLIYMALTFLMFWPCISSAKTSVKKLTSKESANNLAPAMSSIGGGGLKHHSIGLGLGQTFLRRGFAEKGTDGITWDVYYNYNASYSFDLLINVHYSEHKKEDSKVELKGAAIGIKGKIYHFDEFSPFVTGGLGFYQPQETNSDGDTSEDKTVFGIHAGIGADLKLNDKFIAGMIFHYHDPFDLEQERGGKIDGSYYKLLLTLLYTFK